MSFTSDTAIRSFRFKCRTGFLEILSLPDNCILLGSCLLNMPSNIISLRLPRRRKGVPIFSTKEAFFIPPCLTTASTAEPKKTVSSHFR